MKTFKKTLSLLLVLIMCLGTIPFSVGASDIQIDKNCWYTVEDGKATIVFLDASVSGDITVPSYLGGYKVTAIGEGAFNGRDTITSVTIPDTVTIIGKEAFKSCSLKSIKLGKGVTVIGDSAFYYCTQLTGITIPNNVTVIGESAFSNCTALTDASIGKGITTIGQNAFRGCINLKDLTIGSNVTTIGSGAFYDCDSLTSITVPDSVTTIESYAFRGCNKLIAVTLGENVEAIGYGAFAGCSKLTDIYFTGTTKEWNAVSVGSSNTALTEAKVHILGDPIIPIIPSYPDTPSDPNTPDNPDVPDNNPTDCDCKCHAKGFKKFIFKIALFFQKIFRKNKVCKCGALHY